MKRLFIFALAAALCCSCSTTYYYSTLNTIDEHVIRTEDGDFVDETDDLYIIYSFFGENAPMNIGIFNKTDEPIYVDWSQSALIADNIARPLGNGELAIVGDNSHGHGGYDDEDAYLYKSTPSIPKRITFIPPKSQVNYTSYWLAGFPFESISDNHYKKGKFTSSTGLTNIKVAEYDYGKSPIKFKGYITIYTNNPIKTNNKPQVFEQNFYLSKLMKTGGNVHPSSVLDHQTKRGDFFFVRVEKGREAASILGLIAIEAALITLDAAINSHHH